MKKKIVYTNEPMGDIAVVADFLPSPDVLTLREGGLKVTLAQSQSSADVGLTNSTPLTHHPFILYSLYRTKESVMRDKKTYGLEQARAQLPLIAAEAQAGYSSEITRHGKPVAMVVPVHDWQAAQGKQVASGGILALRGTGRGLWPQGAAKAVAQLRQEW